MRNAIVALVLYVGLVAGFVAPQGELKTNDDDQVNFAQIEREITELHLLNENKSNIKNNSTDSISGKRPKVQNLTNQKNTQDYINEKVMYEHGQDKENIVNERSFLFLNQRYNKPSRLQKFHTPAPYCDLFGQLLKDDYAEQLNATPFKFSKPNFEVRYKHLHSPNKMEKITSYFAPPNQYDLDDKEEKNQHKALLGNERREYLELLKEPFLRTVKNQIHYKEMNNQYKDSKKQYIQNSDQIRGKQYKGKQNQYKENLYQHQEKPNQNQDNRAMVFKVDSKNHDGNKYYVIPKTVHDNSRASIAKHDEISHPYMFSQPVFQKELDTAGNNFVSEDDVQTVFSSGEDKQLDTFLKATLTEQFHKERLKSNQANCNYNKCVPKSTKHFQNTKLDSDADCKCGRWAHLKSNNMRDRQQRKELENNLIATTTSPTSAEIRTYEELFTPDPYLNNLDRKVDKVRKFK